MREGVGRGVELRWIAVRLGVWSVARVKGTCGLGVLLAAMADSMMRGKCRHKMMKWKIMWQKVGDVTGPGPDIVNEVVI